MNNRHPNHLVFKFKHRLFALFSFAAAFLLAVSLATGITRADSGQCQADQLTVSQDQQQLSADQEGEYESGQAYAADQQEEENYCDPSSPGYFPDGCTSAEAEAEVDLQAYEGYLTAVQADQETLWTDETQMDTDCAAD